MRPGRTFAGKRVVVGFVVFYARRGVFGLRAEGLPSLDYVVNFGRLAAEPGLLRY